MTGHAPLISTGHLWAMQGDLPGSWDLLPDFMRQVCRALLWGKVKTAVCQLKERGSPWLTQTLGTLTGENGEMTCSGYCGAIDTRWGHAFRPWLVMEA